MLFVSLLGIAQVDSGGVKQAISKLDNALIKQDSAALDILLDGKLSYGHSNGWVQTKKDVWTDFKNGTITYKKINTGSISCSAVGKDWMTVRMNTAVTGTRNGSDFELNLHVLQVWKKEKKGWQLVARQSTKL